MSGVTAAGYRPKRRLAVSTEPFGATLRALMEAEELSYRDLARRTESSGHKLGHAYINMMVNGHDVPTVAAMVTLAKALSVRPEHFAEYRMRMAGRELDFEEVGFDRALRALERWEKAANERRSGK